MKNKLILLTFLGVILILGGCQEVTNVNDDIQKEINKNKQSQVDPSQSQDLSGISGEAKNIAEKINKNKDIKNNSNKNNQNNQNNMNNKDQKGATKEDNSLPIDMSLAKTCKSAILKTNMGDIEIEFFGEKAPMTVANFCTLSKKDFYNNLIFHRVIKDFMIQGGDPNGNGTGDAGYKFKDELYPENSNGEYTIAMANAGPNTNGSQFFINTKANNFLDGKHTVFGKVIKGQDIVDKIETVETGMADKPVEDVMIKQVVITEVK